MATKSSSDGENAVPVEYEKEGPTSVATQQIEAADIDAKDLPKGYFLKPYFVGTLLASGLSVSGVYRRSHFEDSQNSLLLGCWSICSCSTTAWDYQQ
jgi:hypothetical protein